MSWQLVCDSLLLFRRGWLSTQRKRITQCDCINRLATEILQSIWFVYLFIYCSRRNAFSRTCLVAWDYFGYKAGIHVLWAMTAWKCHTCCITLYVKKWGYFISEKVLPCKWSVHTLSWNSHISAWTKEHLMKEPRTWGIRLRYLDTALPVTNNYLNYWNYL